MADDIEKAESFSQIRAVMAPFFGLLVLVIQQGTLYSFEWGSRSLVQIAVWLGFALLMLWFCWRWFSPLELARQGFDTRAFQAATFNFIYAEPTTTLGIKKVWVWLVMWAFALGATLHGLAHVLKRGETPEAEAS